MSFPGAVAALLLLLSTRQMDMMADANNQRSLAKASENVKKSPSWSSSASATLLALGAIMLQPATAAKTRYLASTRVTVRTSWCSLFGCSRKVLRWRHCDVFVGLPSKCAGEQYRHTNSTDTQYNRRAQVKMHYKSTVHSVSALS